MYVYFITGDSNHPIKIGRTNSLPYYRIRQIQNNSPVKITCLGILNGPIDLEVTLHNKFYKSRLWGEWFERSDDLLKYIAENAEDYDHLESNVLPIKKLA